VAQMLGVPVGTVKARLSRGRSVLASLLSDHAADRAPRLSPPPPVKAPPEAPASPTAGPAPASARLEDGDGV
jgi:hypothetical protein